MFVFVAYNSSKIITTIKNINDTNNSHLVSCAEALLQTKESDCLRSTSSNKANAIHRPCTADGSEVNVNKPKQPNKVTTETLNKIELVDQKRLIIDITSDQLPNCEISSSKRRRLRKIRILGSQQPVVKPCANIRSRNAVKTKVEDASVLDQDNKKTKAAITQFPLNRTDATNILSKQGNTSIVKLNPKQNPTVIIEKTEQGCYAGIIKSTNLPNTSTEFCGPIYTHAEINNQTGNISRSNQSKPAETVSTSSISRPLSSSCNISLVGSSNTPQNKMEVVQKKSREDVVAEREAKKKAKQVAKAKSNINISEAKSNPTAVETNSIPVQASQSKEKPISLVPQLVSSTATETTRKLASPESKSGVNKEPKKKTSAVRTSQSSDAITSGVPDSTLVGGLVNARLSKSDTKADRRLKQEAQRALKAKQEPLKQTKVVVSKEAIPLVTPLQTQVITPPVTAIVETSEAKHRVKLFNHLYHKKHLLLNGPIMSPFGEIHPAILCLGVQYAQRIVVGSNARCYALLSAMKKVIEDYRTPPQKEFARGLESCIQASMAYLLLCRSHSVSMTNAIRHLKGQMTQLPHNVEDREAKKKLHDAIDTYLRDQIDVAGQAICLAVQNKISNGDVILTYGCSSLVEHILVSAHKAGTEFRVVVVDARPWREGRQLLSRLVKCGISCSFVLVAAASSIMREVTKVLLGAHALLSNGYVMSRAGSSQMALLARSYSKPVLVCCETHKFCERVQTDSFVYNEIGDPNDLVSMGSHRTTKPLANWLNIPSLTPLNLVYDVTPPDLVTAVVTELGILPCTSIAVILRIKPTDACG